MLLLKLLVFGWDVSVDVAVVDGVVLLTLVLSMLTWYCLCCLMLFGVLYVVYCW